MTSSPPSVRSVRHRVRAWQRARSSGSVGAALTVWGLPLFVTGGLLWQVLVRGELDGLRTSAVDFGLISELNGLLVLGLALVITGASMAAVRALGPLVVDSAAQFWMHSTPLDRAAVLARRYWVSVAGGGCAGVLLARASTLLAPTVQSWWWFGITGAAWGATVLGFGVLAQTSRRWERRFRMFAVGLAGIGALCCGAAALSSVVSAPVIVVQSAAALSVLISLAVVGFGRRLVHRLSRAELERAAGLSTALSAATTSMDSTLVAGEMDVRTWRRVGVVRSRRLSGSRWRIFVDADMRRIVRDRRSLPALVASIAAVYLCSAVLTVPLQPVVLLLACCVVAGRFGRGLRDINASSSFRAVFGGTDGNLRWAHLVVPSATVAVAFCACLPIVWGASVWALLPIPFVALVALYRSSSRPPLEYGGLILETPMGQVPVDMFRQLLRGPLVVLAFAAVQVVVGVG